MLSSTLLLVCGTSGSYVVWTKRRVEIFIRDHPIDTSWKDGQRVPCVAYRAKNPTVFSAVKTITHEDGYGADIHHEIELLSNLRHCPQHTLMTVLNFMRSAVRFGDVTIWNHPNGKLYIMFQEQINPGP